MREDILENISPGVMYDAGQVQHLVSTGTQLDERYFFFNSSFDSDVLSKLKLSLFALIMMPLSATLARTLGKRIGKATIQASKFQAN